jgi:hypothetical protein
MQLPSCRLVVGRVTEPRLEVKDTTSSSWCLLLVVAWWATGDKADWPRTAPRSHTYCSGSCSTPGGSTSFSLSIVSHNSRFVHRLVFATNIAPGFLHMTHTHSRRRDKRWNAIAARVQNGFSRSVFSAWLVVQLPCSFYRYPYGLGSPFTRSPALLKPSADPPIFQPPSAHTLED